VGAAMSVRWTYIDPHTVFNPFIGFQTVLIALIGGAMTLWGPLIAAIVFSVLAETLRLQVPQLYMMSLGVLLILSVLYLPGGLASLRWQTLCDWGQASRRWWRELREDLSGETARRQAREKQQRERSNVF
jgi:branched-chain amino acid transport system permease protein